MRSEKRRGLQEATHIDHHYFLPSQVRSQRAPEALPLILEPESAFYTSPVVVLDFQSLYPSMMIAYNMCYSTCLGKVRRHAEYGAMVLCLLPARSDLSSHPAQLTFLIHNNDQNQVPKPDQLKEGAHLRMGVTTYPTPSGRLATLNNDGNVHVCPNGVM
jgi:DNA polymerase elongation subunit (family B)